MHLRNVSNFLTFNGITREVSWYIKNVLNIWPIWTCCCWYWRGNIGCINCTLYCYCFPWPINEFFHSWILIPLKIMNKPSTSEELSYFCAPAQSICCSWIMGHEPQSKAIELTGPTGLGQQLRSEIPALFCTLGSEKNCLPWWEVGGTLIPVDCVTSSDERTSELPPTMSIWSYYSRTGRPVR